jgi:hypothetical protein
MDFKNWLEAVGQVTPELDQETLGVLWNIPEVMKMIRSGMWDGQSEPYDHQKRIILSALDRNIRLFSQHIRSPSVASYYADPSNNQQATETLARMKRVMDRLQGNPQAPGRRGTINKTLTCPYCHFPVKTPLGAIRTRCPNCRQAFFAKEAGI